MCHFSLLGFSSWLRKKTPPKFYRHCGPPSKYAETKNNSRDVVPHLLHSYEPIASNPRIIWTSNLSAFDLLSISPGKNVYIVQSSGRDTNNHLMDLILFIQVLNPYLSYTFHTGLKLILVILFI